MGIFFFCSQECYKLRLPNKWAFVGEYVSKVYIYSGKVASYSYTDWVVGC